MRGERDPNNMSNGGGGGASGVTDKLETFKQAEINRRLNDLLNEKDNEILRLNDQIVQM